MQNQHGSETYTVFYDCYNCGHDFTECIRVGSSAPRKVECPRCKTNEGHKNITRKA